MPPARCWPGMCPVPSYRIRKQSWLASPADPRPRRAGSACAPGLGGRTRGVPGRAPSPRPTCHAATAAAHRKDTRKIHLIHGVGMRRRWPGTASSAAPDGVQAHWHDGGASPGRASRPRPHEQVRQATSPASVAGFAGSPFLGRALLARFLDMLTTLNVGRAWGPQSFYDGPGCQRARHGVLLRRRTHSCMKGALR
jgi:hypothetical protein